MRVSSDTEHEVSMMGEHGVPTMGEHGVSIMGEHRVPMMGEHRVPMIGEHGVHMTGEQGVSLMGANGVPMLGKHGVPMVSTDCLMSEHGLPAASSSLPMLWSAEVPVAPDGFEWMLEHPTMVAEYLSLRSFFEFSVVQRSCRETFEYRGINENSEPKIRCKRLGMGRGRSKS